MSADTTRFVALVARRLGLEVVESRLADAEAFLARRAGAAARGSASAYLDLVEHDPAELELIARHLTIGETSFFRNADHFRALAELVLPARIEARNRERCLRILSAGCSSGEEPYSIAMLLDERFPELRTWRIEITAFDVNPAALEKAAAARYSSWALRDTPEHLRQRYFRNGELVEDIRRAVRFRQLNLVDDEPAFWEPSTFDVVFCRNVTMYFATQTTRRVIARIAEAMRPGGYLFLGHAETLRSVSDAFELCGTHDTFYYRRGGDASVARVVGREAAPRRDDWFEAIQRASQRVDELTRRKVDAARERGDGELAEVELARAIDLVRQERYVEAKGVLAGLSTSARAQPGVQLVLAAVLANAGEREAAEALCRHLIAREPANAGAHYVLALTTEQAGDLASSADHALSAAVLDPDFAMPRLHLGLLARRGGDVDRARRELSAALSLLEREHGTRLLVFGGGFAREALKTLCSMELAACGAGG